MQRIIVGISGASGFMYGVQALELLKLLGIETHLVVTKSAELTCAHEATVSLADVHALANVVYSVDQMDAAIASGSFKTIGMLVAPCSMHTLAAISSSLSHNLLTRCADVVLKERRRLVLMTRETPLHLGHIRHMEQATLMGAVIFPPVPVLYHKLKTVEEVVTYSVARALDLFGLEVPGILRWEGSSRPI